MRGNSGETSITNRIVLKVIVPFKMISRTPSTNEEIAQRGAGVDVTLYFKAFCHDDNYNSHNCIVNILFNAKNTGFAI